MRSKLFLSYSRGDTEWRDRFLRHLKTMFHVGRDLWVDLEAIDEGGEWRTQLQQALRDSKCALLVTPNYLAHGQFAREELKMLDQEYKAGLRLLPVLVEQCAWKNEPILSELQFVRWQNTTMQVATTSGTREDLRAVKDAWDAMMVERAVLDVCDHVRSALGAAADTTGHDRDALFEATRERVGETVHLEAAIYNGDFSVVYKGRIGSEAVAVKAIPDAARKHRVRTIFEAAVRSLERLRDPAFIRVKFAKVDGEPQCVVMEYVDWPTLDKTLAMHSGRRLPPRIVAKLLAAIAGAQADAHSCGVEIGPISSESLHVNEAWDIRLSPVRIKGQLARAAGLTSGQLMNWDLLTTLTPEIWDGKQPTTVDGLDRHEQYYLGMFGLELLLGRPPFTIRCFDDLSVKAQFFEQPRRFFDDESLESSWTQDCPGLAFVLSRMLARDPAKRLPSATVAADELQAAAEDQLPQCLRRQLETDLEGLISAEFAKGFYERLFARRPSLRELFREPQKQAMKLADTLRDLAEFRANARTSRFLDHARHHATLGITQEDVDAFRLAFIEQVVEASGHRDGSPDAWAAALELGLKSMTRHLHPQARGGAAGGR